MKGTIKQKQKLFSRIEIVNGCWNWLGTTTCGYGYMEWGDKLEGVHRISFEIHKGRKVAKGLCIDHLCRNRKCVNPEHLEEVTYRENLLRGVGASAKNASKTHCKNGHEFSKENIIILKTEWGLGRKCKKCVAVRAALKKRKKYAQI